MQVRNDKARRYLTSMRKKQPIPFAQKFPNADPLALQLLERLSESSFIQKRILFKYMSSLPLPLLLTVPKEIT